MKFSIVFLTLASFSSAAAIGRGEAGEHLAADPTVITLIRRGGYVPAIPPIDSGVLAGGGIEPPCPTIEVLPTAQQMPEYAPPISVVEVMPIAQQIPEYAPPMPVVEVFPSAQQMPEYADDFADDCEEDYEEEEVCDDEGLDVLEFDEDCDDEGLDVLDHFEEADEEEEDFSDESAAFMKENDGEIGFIPGERFSSSSSVKLIASAVGLVLTFI
jgi:hypothetical protein